MPFPALSAGTRWYPRPDGYWKCDLPVPLARLLGWVVEYALKYTLTPLFTFTVIGHIIPALIANDFEIQGIRKTLLGLFIVILSVFGMLNLIMFI